MKLQHKKERELNSKTKRQKVENRRFQNANNKLPKGITLIALVITIIVLLILAGISIATLTGDNGILTKSQIAKEETEKASEEEQRQLAILNAAMNTEKYDYEVEDGKVPIPAGFAPTGIEGENSIKDGVVVVDEKGNEFVWIPVTAETKYERQQRFLDINFPEKTPINDTNYLPDGVVASGENEVDKEKEIVLKAGGFYIGRYEAGSKGGKLQETKNEQGEITNANWTEEPTIVCKKGANIYNWITQEEAKTKAKEFINKEDVKSALISGIQWDVVMAFINNKKDGTGNIFDVTKFNVNRHTGNPATTGQNIADKVCNIYDLEGNYSELVAEISKYTKNDNEVSAKTVMGGHFDAKYERPAYFYGCSSTGKTHIGTFRIVLYVMK